MAPVVEAPWVVFFARVEAEGAVPVLSSTSAEQLFVVLASWLDADDGDGACGLAESILGLWEQLHGVAGRPTLN